MKMIGKFLILVWFSIYIVIWVAGVVIAKGFLQTIAAVMTSGIYSLYLVVELLMIKYGFITGV